MEYNKDIETDGHEDPKHIKSCRKAGANLFAVGSYLGNKDLKKAVVELNKSL